jgi:hypothetical protein
LHEPGMHKKWESDGESLHIILWHGLLLLQLLQLYGEL